MELVMPGYDAIVIGTGQAGPSLAFRLADAGMKVAVVERHLVGGTCVNAGCTPTKALVATAYAARIARRAAEYGVMIGGDIAVDMRQVKARKGERRKYHPLPRACSVRIVASGGDRG
jgi:pyruvate/2-oxoglutarate dehydrogenase complex dihydrolipoamide dehydrogenase (E3) component